MSYLKGLLRLKTDWNIAEIAREAELSEQNMQHFISNSAWSRSEMIEQAISEHPELEAGVLIVDESADLPYLPLIPNILQFALFGLPAFAQVITRTTFMPLALGVNQINIVRKG